LTNFIIKVPKILSDCDWSAISSKYASLVELAEEISKIGVSITDDVGRSAAADDLAIGLDPQETSDSSSLMSDDTIFDVVEDLKAYHESLQDLTQSLENPAKDLPDQTKSKNPRYFSFDSIISTSGNQPHRLNMKTGRDWASSLDSDAASIQDSAIGIGSSRNSVVYRDFEVSSVADSGIAGISSKSSSTRGSMTRRYTPDFFLLRNRAKEYISDELFSLDESEDTVKYLEKWSNENLKRTYVEGVPVLVVDKSAAVPSVGLTFLLGADPPQVVRHEISNIAGIEPDQKSALWRINTAASLLTDFVISTDFSITKRYNADSVQTLLNRTKKSIQLQGHDSQLQANRNSNIAFASKARDREPITIDSDLVKVVNNLQEHQWDLQSMLIEVDGSSLLNLIINFTHLISRGESDMNPEETKTLLDTMMEDTRRLYVLSPVLFRMSTRSRIIRSKHTRYGINNRSMFRTITTSQGIKEIISLSAAYYIALDPDDNSDKTQKHIRPRFLQMIVMLLSLLNDDDLADIADYLESSFQLKADRKNLEMLFLKVIPLRSINSKVFLSSLVPAFEEFPLPINQTDSEAWDVFVQRIMTEGYLLPGTILDLGRENKSWIVKWPDEGFTSSQVFKNLQYAGRLRTINNIPPISARSESIPKELTAIFTNGETYTISSTDLEHITILTPGKYNVQEASPGSQNYDLVITEYYINADLNETIRKSNALVRKFNNLLTTFIRKGFRDKLLSHKNHEIAPLNECESSGRITKSVVELNKEILAVAYKLEGRNITTRDTMSTMAQDIREIKSILYNINRRITEISNENPDMRWLHFEMNEITSHISHAERARHEVAEEKVLLSEPIAKIPIPEELEHVGDPIWFEYTAWNSPQTGNSLMHLEAKRSHVDQVTWLSEIGIEVKLVRNNVKFYVTPLMPVLETEREDLIRQGDIAVLAGKYMIIAEPVEGAEEEGSPLYMVNYLRITSMEEIAITRRGSNRAQKMSSNVISLFR
jgi:hypothetical protein